MRARVEWSYDRGVIDLGGGRFTPRTLPDVLVLRVEAADGDTLQMVQRRLGDRLEQGDGGRAADRHLGFGHDVPAGRP